MKNNPNNSKQIVFGTSSLGNLYKVLDFEVKKEIVSQAVNSSSGIAIFDSAGKYGAGLSLEVLGESLDQLGIDPKQVIISNKLGWYRVPLETPEPTFEKDVWKELKYDAIQRISYEGILDCFEQGNQLLGKYHAQMVSVHDADEYLAASSSLLDHEQRYRDIIDAYKALNELKKEGKVSSIGIGAKEWKIIEKIAGDVKLDWIMIANSLTVHSHPPELVDFISQVSAQGIKVINSAVFNGGFLIGGDFYNYSLVDAASEEGQRLLNWRNAFFRVCMNYNVTPAEVCCTFALSFTGVSAIALSSSRPDKIKENVEMVNSVIPRDFWQALQEEGLIKNI